MAYEKQNWECGQVITADKLNHMEDGIANAGGDCDCGYECTETVTMLTEESVTTVEDGGDIYGTLSYSQFIDAETLKVTFNGTEYECRPIYVASNVRAYGGADAYGNFDFSQYPFALFSMNGTISSNSINTETAGTYTIKVEAVETTVTTTPCFDKARGYSCEEIIATLTEESVTTELQGNVAYGELSYSQPIDADSITVTFEGVEYECPRLSDDTYGAPYIFSTDTFDWSEYPFHLYSYSSDGNAIQTETAGTYSVKIGSMQEVAITTPCFEAAVKQANSSMGSIKVPQQAITVSKIRSTGITGSPYAIPANSSATVRFTLSEKLSENAALHSIIVPTGILLGKIQPLQSAYVDVDLYNATASSITLTNNNVSIDFIDFVEPYFVCVMMSDGCSSPGPSPK